MMHSVLELAGYAARVVGSVRLVRLASFVLLAAGALVASCGGETGDMTPIDPSKKLAPSADVAELEIRGKGVDRFTSCPPPGELGQHWIPAPFPWSPPALAADAPAIALDPDFLVRTQGITATEQAIEATHRDFRSCYRRSLVHDPTQDGRVAIVLRVGPDGRVAKTEEYAACELSGEAIECMKGVASRLRFPPPSGGSDTITIPVVFTSRDGVPLRAAPSPNDAYTATAYVTLETARPALHACETEARRDHRPLQATGTFTMELAPDGHVSRAHVDPWSGEQSLLVCAAHVLEKLTFPAPPRGRGVVIARLNFNPRQGTR